MAFLKRRGSAYYIQFCVGQRQRRISTDSESFQIAREKLRAFESTEARGDGSPLPSRSPIADVVTAYVKHLRAMKTAKSARQSQKFLRLGSAENWPQDSVQRA